MERRLAEDYIENGQVRFAFRHLAFLGNESRWAAEATECANEQDQFWAYYDKLFAEQGPQSNQGAYSLENLKTFAADIGLETDQFNQCLDDGKYRNKVQQESDEAQSLGVNSTPTVFVNGQLIRNGSDYQTLQTAVEAALARQ